MHQLRHPFPRSGGRAPLGRAPVIVFACGNGLRGDDGVATRAVRLLAPDIRRHIEVRYVSALGPQDLVALPAAVRVVIVDAVVGPPPGTVVSLDLEDIPASRSPGAGRFTASSHQLPLGDVIALGRVLRDAPLEGSFVGLAIASVAVGTDVSAPVRAALPALRDAVAAAVLDRPSRPG
jgi:hydrogenase maturation protease